jgi:hypothetical protein
VVPAIDLFDDAFEIGGPEERFGLTVVLADVSVDRRLQVDERMEDTALQSPACDGGKKAFDRVGPGP